MAKVSIIGSGNVGANTAFFIAEKGVEDIWLHDVQEGTAAGKSLDMMEAAPIRKYRNRIRGMAGIGDAAGSETVIIAAGKACAAGGGREAPLAENWATVRSIMEQVMRVSPEGIVIIATEPVDEIVALAAADFGLPRARLFGLGGLLDSARLTSALSRILEISTEDITSMVIGRHGNGMIMLRGCTRVSGIPIGSLLSDDEIGRLMGEVRSAGRLMAELSECPGSYYTPSAAAADIVNSIHMDLKRIMTVSVELQGEYDIRGAALSLPCVIGAAGVEKVMTPDLLLDEREALTRSAEAVRDAVYALRKTDARAVRS